MKRGHRCMQSLAGCYTIVALLFLAGCATTSAGRSGPVAWEAVDSTVQGGGSKALHSFTLVLREREGQSLAFHRKLTFVGGFTTPMSEERVDLRLPAGGELRLPVQFRTTCIHCNASGGALSWYAFEFEGQDDSERAVRLQMAVQPPLARYIGDLPWVLWEIVHHQNGPTQHFSVDFFADDQTCRNEMDSRNNEQLARGEKRATFICLRDNVNPRGPKGR